MLLPILYLIALFAGIADGSILEYAKIWTQLYTPHLEQAVRIAMISRDPGIAVCVIKLEIHGAGFRIASIEVDEEHDMTLKGDGYLAVLHVDGSVLKSIYLKVPVEEEYDEEEEGKLTKLSPVSISPDSIYNNTLSTLLRSLLYTFAH